MRESTFHTSESTLDDDSPVYAVFLSDSEGQTMVLDAPSILVAEYLSHALNDLTNRFSTCGSDREVVLLGIALEKFLIDHNNKAG